jgi:hypothetical protein
MVLTNVVVSGQDNGLHAAQYRFCLAQFNQVQQQQQA